MMSIDVTHSPKFYQVLGALDEADIRYLRGCCRHYLGLRSQMPSRTYYRHGVHKSIPEGRAERLRTLARTFVR